jgi:hypothetical protein
MALISFPPLASAEWGFEGEFYETGERKGGNGEHM